MSSPVSSVRVLRLRALHKGHYARPHRLQHGEGRVVHQRGPPATPEGRALPARLAQDADYHCAHCCHPRALRSPNLFQAII